MMLNHRAAHPETLPRVTVIIVNYNHAGYLHGCLDSLSKQTYENFEVLLVDNGSTDHGVSLVEDEFSWVKILTSPSNVGFGQGNNLGASKATGEYLAFLNPDTVVDPNWLRPLVRILLDNEDVGLVTSKILLLNQPEKINTCGNDIHFTGLPACRGWQLPSEEMSELEEISSVSGAAFVISTKLFHELGGFDDCFFLYLEDNDLSLRAQLAGYRVLYVPQSIVYHEYVPRFASGKFHLLERNRYRMLLKTWKWPTLLLLGPALFVAELVTWGFALLCGRDHLVAKLLAYNWILKHWTEVMRDRKWVQMKRKALDSGVLSNCSTSLAYSLAQEGPAARLAATLFDPLFSSMHRFYMAIIDW